jgi:hypothetical protein
LSLVCQVGYLSGELMRAGFAQLLAEYILRRPQKSAVCLNVSCSIELVNLTSDTGSSRSWFSEFSFKTLLHLLIA